MEADVFQIDHREVAGAVDGPVDGCHRGKQRARENMLLYPIHTFSQTIIP